MFGLESEAMRFIWVFESDSKGVVSVWLVFGFEGEGVVSIWEELGVRAKMPVFISMEWEVRSLVETSTSAVLGTDMGISPLGGLTV